MDIVELREYCISKPHSSEGFPFGQDVLVFKVAGKMFALCSIDDPNPSVNLKCDPEKAVELRELHPEITPGYHMHKRMWNTVSLQGRLSDAFIRSLIDHSYDEVVKSLTLKSRRELGL